MDFREKGGLWVCGIGCLGDEGVGALRELNLVADLV